MRCDLCRPGQENTGLCRKSHVGTLPLRPELFDPLPVKDEILPRLRRLLGVTPPEKGSAEAQCRAIAIGGHGGVGKSELAAWLVSDEEVLRHFQTQIFWVTLGKVNMSGLISQMEELKSAQAARYHWLESCGQ